MNPVKKLTLAALLSGMLIGCPRVPLESPEQKEKIISDLISRRQAMSVIEADVNFHFSQGFIFTTSLNAHAVYKLGEEGPMLRLVAFGPMGIQALDLLVMKGDFQIKVPGRDKPMSQADLCAIYGEGALTRIPSLLARRPGLFFGGIPEGLNQEWEFRQGSKEVRLEAPDGSAFLIAGIPPVIKKAIIKEPNIGTLIVELDGWDQNAGGLFPTEATIKFNRRPLFNFKIESYKIGPDLPPDVFIMSALSPTRLHNLLKINSFYVKFQYL